MTLPAKYTIHRLRNHEALLYNSDDGSVAILNPTAAFIWRRFLKGLTPEDVVAAFLQEWPEATKQVPNPVAMVQGILDQPPVGLRSPVTSPYSCRNPVAHVLELHFDRRLVLALDLEAKTLTVTDRRPQVLRTHLEALAPKMFSLLGYHVFHGAWVQLGTTSWLLSGNSGAGKSTFARALVAAGGRLLADDKVLVTPSESDGVGAFVEGEAAMQTWIRRTFEMLVLKEASQVNPLLPIEVSRRMAKIGMLAVLDVDQRRDDCSDIHEIEMGSFDATRVTIQQTFFAVDSLERSTELIRSCTAMHRGLRTCRLVVPAGLERLASAVKTYTAKTIS